MSRSSQFEPTIGFPVIESLQHIDKKHLSYLAEPNWFDGVLENTLLKLIPKAVTPNAVTIFRFLTVPVIALFLFREAYLVAGILFVISAFSDAVDGSLARTRNKVTDWGVLFDPLADKLLVGTVALMLISKILSPYVALLIVTLEMLILLSVFFRFQKKIVPAKTVGKIKMVCQSTGISLLFLYTISPSLWLLGLATFFLGAAILFALLSLFVYRSI